MQERKVVTLECDAINGLGKSILLCTYQVSGLRNGWSCGMQRVISCHQVSICLAYSLYLVPTQS